MLEQIIDEIIGLGPLEPLLRDETITDIMVNGPRPGLRRANGQAGADQRRVPRTTTHLMRIIERIVAPSAAASTSRRRWSTPACPTARASTRSSRRCRSTARRSRSASSRPTPLTVRGPASGFGTMTPDMLDFLRALRRGAAEHHRSPAAPARARRRSSTCSRAFIPDDERIVTIEDAAELQLQQRARRAPRDAPAEHRRARARSRIRDLVQQLPAHAARPHRRRRVPRRRGAGHAPGHEHRPRWLADHAARQHPARRAVARSRRWC